MSMRLGDYLLYRKKATVSNTVLNEVEGKLNEVYIVNCGTFSPNACSLTDPTFPFSVQLTEYWRPDLNLSGRRMEDSFLTNLNNPKEII